MNREQLIESFGKELKSLYKEMIIDFKNEMPKLPHPPLPPDFSKYYWLSCAQWGKYYPLEESQKGILFYGRSTNNWGECYDVDSVFTPPYADMFSSENRMAWLLHNNKAFRNIVKKVAEHWYNNEFNEHIAWSNICKIAPEPNVFNKMAKTNEDKRDENGNPTDDEYNAQYNSIVKVIRAELNFFSPKIVVLITGLTASNTGRWDYPLFEAIGHEQPQPNSENSIVWHETKSSQCKALVEEINGTIYVICDRPERRQQYSPDKAIIDLIEKYL